MHRIAKLKNGLSFVTVPVKGTKAVTVFVLVPVGSRYENKKINGISHFVEHMMFNGTKKRPTNLDISRSLDAAGAHFNAMTHKEYTGYYIKIDGKKQKLALDILSDMLFNSLFNETEISKEKKVITEEIKMYEDNPMMAVEDLAEKTLYGDHPLGRNIAGTAKIIGNLSRKDLWSYYKSAYAPENMVLVASGAVSGRTNKLVRKYFGEFQGEAKIKYKNYEGFSGFGEVSLARRVLVEKRKIDQAHIFFSFPGLKKGHKKQYAMAVLLNILGGGMSSRLFVEVREKRGLAYRVKAEAASYRDTGAVHIIAGLDQNRLVEACTVIRNEIKKIAKVPVTAKELADAKSNIAGSMTLVMEDSEAQAQWFADRYWFHGKLETYQNIISKINKVTIRQVFNLAKEIFKEKSMRITVISAKNKNQVIQCLK